MLSRRIFSRDSSLAKFRLIFMAITLAFAGVLLPACKSESGAPAATSGATATKPAASGESANLPRPTDAKASLEALMKGNERYVNNQFAARDLSQAKFSELAKGQKPFAIVLTCSDSRVSPELLFDQSQGDLFVIRVAGNVMDKAGIGSIEYCAEHLHAPLIYVLGHEKCGAVTAATTDGPAEGNLQFIVNEIKPAVQTAKTQAGDLVSNSVSENVKYVVNNMAARSEILDHLVKEKKVLIAGGVYNLADGKVKTVADLTDNTVAAEGATH